MEVGGRPIQKTEAVTNYSNPFQTRRFLPVVMGEQDMQVLMPHGNWSWGPFSQLANQLTGCRRKTTARTLPGLPIPGCKPPRDFLMAEFLGNPAHLRQLTKLLVWPVEWSPLPLPWQSSVRELSRAGTKRRPHPAQLTSPLPSVLWKSFMEKPSANQRWYCAEFRSCEFATNQNTKLCFVQCIYNRAALKRTFSPNMLGY